MHGYEDIDTGSTKDGQDKERNPNAVTVRSEVARLTRLYDRAVRNNTVNNPDMYMTGAVDGSYGGAVLRSRGSGGAVPVAVAPVAAPVVTVSAGQPGVAGGESAPALVHDPDESPATAPPKPKEEKKVDEPKTEGKKAEESEEDGTKEDGTKEDGTKPEVKGDDDAKGKGKADGDSSDADKTSKAPSSADNPSKADSPTPASSAHSAGSAAFVKQEPAIDPDAEPASDPNVPLKKVAGDPTDGES